MAGGAETPISQRCPPSRGLPQRRFMTALGFAVLCAATAIYGPLLWMVDKLRSDQGTPISIQFIESAVVLPSDGLPRLHARG